MIGREADLSIIWSAWEKANAGSPQLLVLRADAGIGKTRLVQEFYCRLSGSADPDDYWPNALPDTRDGMTIVPPTSPRTIAETPPLPWLWLAMRCRDETARNRDARGDVAFDVVRRQLATHLAGLYRADAKRTGNTALAKGGLGVLASFALPGSGAVVEAISQTISTSSEGMTVWDTIKAARGRFDSRHRGAVNPSAEAIEKEAASLEAEAARAFQAIADPRNRRAPSVPIVLVVDDAHWADSTTLRVVDVLLRAARDGSWPLLVIATAWDETLTRQEFDSGGADTFGSFLTRSAEDDHSVREHSIKPLTIPQVKRLIARDFPIPGTAAEILADRASGDLDVLFDYLEVLRREPGWVDRNGKLIVPLSELQNLPTRALDLARRRLRTLDPETQEVLAWAAAEGIRFHAEVVERLLGWGDSDQKVVSVLERSDSEFAVTKVSPHPTLQLCGEFRRPAYYEVAKEWLDRIGEPQQVRATLARSLRGVMHNEQHWSRLEARDRARISRRLAGLADVFEEAEQPEFLATVHLELARGHQMMGDASGAADAAERVIDHAPRSFDQQRLVARRILVQSAYMNGDLEGEQRELASWVDAEGESPELLLREANLAVRSSDPDRGVAACRRVLENHSGGDGRYLVEASTTLAMALWSQGSAEGGLAELAKCEEALEGTLARRPELRTSVDHSAALILHDLERNLQVAEHADACVQAYATLGQVESAIISRVNLGDAWWGAGRPELAANLLEKAYQDAVDSALPHAQDIAALCYANVLASAGNHERALELYDEGIELARRIGHDWDLLYGRIYRGLCSAEHNRDEPETVEELWNLAGNAASSDYHYLEWLARSYAVLAAIATNSFDQANRLGEMARQATSRNTPPGPRAYLAAADIVVADEGSVGRTQAVALLRSLGRCEGIKGRPFLVSAALDRLPEAGLLQTEQEFVDRWRARFIVGGDARAPTLRRCDYRACEARCCYDGVYLDPDEVERITSVVQANPEFFSHVPTENVVEGEWGESSGPKTAVRAQEYQSPDFPDHFTDTRCVFAFEDGACSLQAFGEEHGTHPWEYKPRGCWIHPLHLENDQAAPPPLPGERDPSYVGVAYPGYVSFTPCGQHRTDGKPWDVELQEEVAATGEHLEKGGRERFEGQRVKGNGGPDSSSQ